MTQLLFSRPFGYTGSGVLVLVWQFVEDLQKVKVRMVWVHWKLRVEHDNVQTTTSATTWFLIWQSRLLTLRRSVDWCGLYIFVRLKEKLCI